MLIACNGARIAGPKVGQRTMEASFFGSEQSRTLQPATVIYVNYDHGYYTVQFDIGYRESFPFSGRRGSDGAE